jgi:hypothetical protein
LWAKLGITVKHALITVLKVCITCGKYSEFIHSIKEFKGENPV